VAVAAYPVEVPLEAVAASRERQTWTSAAEGQLSQEAAVAQLNHWEKCLAAQAAWQRPGLALAV